jgi:antitoxin component YwqK of YwqJK toxin-antitoxin module
MKTTTLARFFSVSFIVALALATSCKDDDGANDPDDATCLLTKKTVNARLYIGTPDEYTYIAVFAYNYDEKGNQTESSTQYNNTYSNGKKSTSASKASMQYDADNFLVRTERVYNSTDADGLSSTSLASEEFTYADGRLTKRTVTSTDNGKSASFVNQYEYDAEGKLIKYSNTYNNSAMTFTYSGKIVQKITVTDAGGNVTSPFVQFNDKGALVKSIDTRGGSSDENRYEYTADGQIAREERYINGKPSSATIYEYDTHRNPDWYTYARPKGHPVLPDIRANYIWINNVVRVTYLGHNAEETDFETAASSFYVYDYNAKGFPTAHTLTTSNAAGAPQSTNTVTYEYINCN